MHFKPSLQETEIFIFFPEQINLNSKQFKFVLKHTLWNFRKSYFFC